MQKVCSLSPLQQLPRRLGLFTMHIHSACTVARGPALILIKDGRKRHVRVLSSRYASVVASSQTTDDDSQSIPSISGEWCRENFTTSFRNCASKIRLSLPPPRPLPGVGRVLPFVFVGDEAFLLKINVKALSWKKPASVKIGIHLQAESSQEDN